MYMLQFCITWRFRVKGHRSSTRLNVFTGNLHSFRHCTVAEQRTHNRLKEQWLPNAENCKDKSCWEQNGGLPKLHVFLHTPYPYLALGRVFAFSDLEREYAIGSSYLNRTNPDPRAHSIQIWLAPADIKLPHILIRVSCHVGWLNS